VNVQDILESCYNRFYTNLLIFATDTWKRFRHA